MSPQPPMHQAPLVLVGNALSVLVAATERARHGQRTTVVKPGGPWGGYFAGVRTGGRLWDAGMVLYEFSSFRSGPTAPDLQDYRPWLRNDVGRFCEVVRDFVARHQTTRPVAPPTMHLPGQLLPDLLLSNQLGAAKHLPHADKMREELQAILQDPALVKRHPRYKQEWPTDGRDEHGQTLMADDVSRAVHGQTFHDTVIQPFIQKVMGRPHSKLAALYHRMTWLPLYWPETLLASLQGQVVKGLDTHFDQPRGETVAALCERLSAEMLASPLVTVIHDQVSAVHDRPDGHQLKLAQGGALHARRLGWAMTPAQGLMAAGAQPDANTDTEDRLAVTLMFLRLPLQAQTAPLSVMHCLDLSTGFYRVSKAVDEVDTNGQATSFDIVVEANPDHFAQVHGAALDDASAVRAALQDLAKVGLIQRGTTADHAHVMALKSALPLPTHRSLCSFTRQHAQLKALWPLAHWLGPCAAPFASSMSEQILQGLQLAAGKDQGVPAPCAVLTQ